MERGEENIWAPLATEGKNDRKEDGRRNRIKEQVMIIRIMHAAHERKGGIEKREVRGGER